MGCQSSAENQTAASTRTEEPRPKSATTVSFRPHVLEAQQEELDDQVTPINSNNSGRIQTTASSNSRKREEEKLQAELELAKSGTSDGRECMEPVISRAFLAAIVSLDEQSTDGSSLMEGEIRSVQSGSNSNSLGNTRVRASVDLIPDARRNSSTNNIVVVGGQHHFSSNPLVERSAHPPAEFEDQLTILSPGDHGSHQPTNIRSQEEEEGPLGTVPHPLEPARSQSIRDWVSTVDSAKGDRSGSTIGDQSSSSSLKDSTSSIPRSSLSVGFVSTQSSTNKKTTGTPLNQPPRRHSGKPASREEIENHACGVELISTSQLGDTWNSLGQEHVSMQDIEVHRSPTSNIPSHQTQGVGGEVSYEQGGQTHFTTEHRTTPFVTSTSSTTNARPPPGAILNIHPTIPGTPSWSESGSNLALPTPPPGVIGSCGGGASNTSGIITMRPPGNVSNRQHQNHLYSQMNPAAINKGLMLSSSTQQQQQQHYNQQHQYKGAAGNMTLDASGSSTGLGSTFTEIKFMPFASSPSPGSAPSLLPAVPTQD